MSLNGFAVNIGVLGHDFVKGCLECLGIDSVTDKNLNRVEHFFEKFLEVTGLKDFVGVVGSALAVAIAIGLLFEENVIAVNVFENCCLVNVPRFEAGSGKMGSCKVNATTLSCREISAIELRFFKPTTIK